MAFNPGFNLSLQSGFQLPKGFGAGAGAAASAASGFSPWGMLLGLGGNFLNYFLGQASASTAYDRQKELMNLSQDYNSEEAMKQRQMSSMSHLRGELHRLGLNPDLMYQNGATQGSMSNAASAGAPSVMPANVPTFDGIFQAMNVENQRINAEAAAQNAETNFANSQAQIKKINSEVELLRSTIANIDAETYAQNLENSIATMLKYVTVQRAMDEATLTGEQAQQAVYLTRRMCLELYLMMGHEVFKNSFPGMDVDKIFGSLNDGLKDFKGTAYLDAKAKELANLYMTGQITAQDLQNAWQSIVNSTGGDYQAWWRYHKDEQYWKTDEQYNWYLKWSGQSLSTMVNSTMKGTPESAGRGSYHRYNGESVRSQRRF